jgi:hypothetical protein
LPFNLDKAHLDAPDRKLRGSDVQAVRKHAEPMLRDFPNQIDLGMTIEDRFGNDAG